MDIEKIQKEISIVRNASFAAKSDKQLWSYQDLSERYYAEYDKSQPKALIKYNHPFLRKCKLTESQVREIRAKYNPYVYGKKRLAIEYGVSKSVIMRIIQGKSWRIGC